MTAPTPRPDESQARGPIYISPEGIEAIAMLRLSRDVPAATTTTPPAQLLACLPSDECGCPEEIWRVDGIDCLIHFEANGSSEAFLFAGEWEAERTFQSRNMAELRAHLFRWIADLVVEGEGA